MKTPDISTRSAALDIASRPSHAGAAASLVSAIWARWLAVYLFALMWFGTLGYRKLISPDEGRYAEIGREMLGSGDWITPRLNGIKYFEKPPLQYWMTALSYKLFGENEFAARFWPALTGVAALLAVLATLRRVYRAHPQGESMAWGATALLGSCAWWMGNGHFLTLDMGVTAFLTMALCGFVWAQQPDATERESRNAMLGAWIAMALATLSKGLIGLVIPGATLVLYSLWMQDRGIWSRLYIARGLALYLVIAAPWFVLVSERNPEFAQFFFVHEHFQRFATHEAQRVQPWFFYIPVLVGGVLPWTTLLPAIVRKGFARSTPAGDKRSFDTPRFLLVWAAFVFLFFSMSGSKLPAYILPMFPALAMIAAPVLLSFGNKTAWSLVITQVVVAVAILIGAPIMSAHAAQSNSPTDAQFAVWLYISGAAFVGAAALTVWLHLKQSRPVLIAGVALSSLLVTQLPLLGYDVYSAKTSAAPLAQVVRPLIATDTTVYTVGMYDQSLPFYLKRTVQLVDYVDEFHLGQTVEPDKLMHEATFVQHWHADRAPMAVMGRDTYQRLLGQDLAMRVVYQDVKRVVVERP